MTKNELIELLHTLPDDLVIETYEVVMMAQVDRRIITFSYQKSENVLNISLDEEVIK